MSLQTSAAFRQYYMDGRAPLVRAVLRLADDTTVQVGGDRIMVGGLSLTGATSPASDFSIGSAIVGTATVTLANYDGWLDLLDLEGATLLAYAGAEVAGGTEWALLGTYDVDAPTTRGMTYPLQCRDWMGRFEVAYSEVTTAYPATLATIVSDICSHVGITLATSTFTNSSHVVQARPTDDLSCIDMLGFVAQLACSYARMTPDGRLSLGWYDPDAFGGSESWLDGGTFSGSQTPYADGDAANGGAFMTGGDTASGGSFDGPRDYSQVSAIRSLTTGAMDVTITGLRVTAQDEVVTEGEGAEGESYQYGQDGYVLAIEGNPLVPYGSAQAVAAMVAPYVVGLSFRPLDSDVIGDPSLQAGDAMVVTDRLGRTYRTYVTQATWSSGGSQRLACGAQAPSRRAMSRTGVVTRAIKAVNDAVRRVTTATQAARQVADEARSVADAIGQHFWTGDDGVHVTQVTEKNWNDSTSQGYHSGPNILVNSLGMLLRSGLTNLASWTSGAVAFYDGLGNAAGNIMARFGRDGAQIGLEGESHVELDYRSMKMVDKDGTTFFHVSDLRGSNGLAEITDSFTGDGTTEMFLLSFEAASSSYVVEVNGVEVTSGINKDVDAFFFDTAPNNGASINATYGTASQDAKAYTAGTRWSGGTVGPMSFVEGRSNIASGDCSHAEGFSTTASDSFAHAEGFGTVASGRYSHAEGFESIADGLHSHAQNRGTRALSAGQTAIGRYNTEDANNTYAFMVGNGNGANQRSNALALQWDGTLELYSPLPVSSGGTGTTAFGTVKSANGTVSVSSGTGTAICSVTLEAGTWLIEGNLAFVSNGTGRRIADLATASGSVTAGVIAQTGVEVPATSGGYTALHTGWITTRSSATTVYLNAYQDSGSSLSATGYIRAVRIA